MRWQSSALRYGGKILARQLVLAFTYAAVTVSEMFLRMYSRRVDVNASSLRKDSSRHILKRDFITVGCAMIVLYGSLCRCSIGRGRKISAMHRSGSMERF